MYSLVAIICLLLRSTELNAIRTSPKINAASSMVVSTAQTPLNRSNEQQHAKELELLPTLQFGRLYSTQSDGRKIFITPNSLLVCEHGERASTILHWLSAEKKAKQAGLPIPARGGTRGLSTCDCKSTEGLNVKINDTVCAPAAPASLFSFLEECNTEQVMVKGTAARRIPHLSGPTFLMSNGRRCCRHGASRKSLIKKQRTDRPSSRLPVCGCTLDVLPVRYCHRGAAKCPNVPKRQVNESETELSD